MDKHVSQNIDRNFDSHFVKTSNSDLGTSDKALDVSRVEGKILKVVKNSGLVGGVRGCEKFDNGLPDQLCIAFVVRSDNIGVNGRIEFGGNYRSKVDIIGLGKADAVVEKSILDALDV